MRPDSSRSFAGFTLRASILLLLALTIAPEISSGQAPFDHYTTGFRLSGAHRFADCESCHIDGLFAGTPTRCSGCHAQQSRVNATSQPPFHVTTTDRCDACHRSSTWIGITRVDHLEVLGSCSSCHDGQKAGGKKLNHLPAGDQCDDCHRTTAWVPAAFDHAAVTGGCFSCHNGVIAQGKPPMHIPATDLCEDCHNTVMWPGVSRVDHLQVLGSCSSCHNGTIADGKPAQHIPTTAECDSCHNTMAWQ